MVFIKKNVFTLTNKWSNRKLRQIMVDRDQALIDEEYCCGVDLKKRIKLTRSFSEICGKILTYSIFLSNAKVISIF